MYHWIINTLADFLDAVREVIRHEQSKYNGD